MRKVIKMEIFFDGADVEKMYTGMSGLDENSEVDDVINEWVEFAIICANDASDTNVSIGRVHIDD